ncbi:MAG TPA: GNAT family N-acetyltransferase [Candidatus Limnocylindria bacterium]|jgi:GNAT superfamily N-acetyltransferase
MAVRPARTEDTPALAVLAGQLGYPTSSEELSARLPEVAANPDAVILVAGERDDVQGWIHVELKRSLLAPLAAQVMGLVVDERRRSEGIGAALLAAGEAWARERGCRSMLVGTRVTRERAHRFYRRAGYDLLKTSHFFEKGL